MNYRSVNTNAYYPTIKQLVLTGSSIENACKIVGISDSTFHRKTDKKLLEDLTEITGSRNGKTTNAETALIIETWVSCPDLTNKQVSEVLGLPINRVNKAMRRYYRKRESDTTEVITLQSKINDH